MLKVRREPREARPVSRVRKALRVPPAAPVSNLCPACKQAPVLKAVPRRRLWVVNQCVVRPGREPSVKARSLGRNHRARPELKALPALQVPPVVQEVSRVLKAPRVLPEVLVNSPILVNLGPACRLDLVRKAAREPRLWAVNL